MGRRGGPVRPPPPLPPGIHPCHPETFLLLRYPATHSSNVTAYSRPIRTESLPFHLSSSILNLNHLITKIETMITQKHSQKPPPELGILLSSSRRTDNKKEKRMPTLSFFVNASPRTLAGFFSSFLLPSLLFPSLRQKTFLYYLCPFPFLCVSDNYTFHSIA